MKILIDIGHPAHVHYFKNFIRLMENKGHEFMIVAKDRDVTYKLLEQYKINYKERRNYPSSVLLKLLNIPLTDLIILNFCLGFKPDILIGFSGTHIAHVGWLLRIPSIVIDDTDNAKLAHASYVPFAKTILTPNCFKKNFGSKHIFFDGYMELSYLHPKYFKADKSVLKELGVIEDEKYFLFRFVSWTANHDIGHKGISHQNKIELVKTLEKYGKIFITSEVELPCDLEPYKTKIKPHRMHDAIAYSTLFYGESATMCSEAVILGVPAIYVDSESRCYTKEQEDIYGAIFNFSESEDDQKKSIKKAIELVSVENLKTEWEKRRNRIIRDKIDVTSFLVWFVEEYPQSLKTMRENPNYQTIFKQSIN